MTRVGTARGFQHVLRELQAVPVLDRAAVDRALDAALSDGCIDRNERTALGGLLAAAPDRFDAADTRRRLAVLVQAPATDVVALARGLERDGVLGIADARQLAGKLGTGGAPVVAALHAVMAGMKLTPAAENLLATTVGHGSPDRRARLDAQPLRTFSLGGPAGPTLVSRGGISALAPPATGRLRDIDAAGLTRALGTAAKNRLTLARSGATRPTSRVVTEDGSLRVTAFHMAAIGADQTGLTYPRQMAQIGKLEGFTVVLRVPVEHAAEARRAFRKEGLTNVHVVGVAGEGDFWSEDQGEFDVEGNVRVPAPAPPYAELYEVGLRDRLQRMHPGVARKLGALPFDKLVEKLRADHPDVLFAMVGAVAERKSHEVLAGAALAGGHAVQASLAHLEGGNVLVGTRADGTGYALVGRDSLVHSRHILEKDRGRAVSDEELRAAVAHDLGIRPTDIVPVEQPGDFHLDMHLTPVGPGAILLNDPVAAAALQEQWDREDHAARKPASPPDGAPPATVEAYRDELRFWGELGQEMEARFKDARGAAQRQARFDARVVRDLEAGGMTVHRAPAVFGERPVPRANFINGEQGTNPRGERFFIALGGDPRAERAFADALHAVAPGVARVHFLDREMTMTTLTAGGGISCRAKAAGTLG